MPSRYVGARVRRQGFASVVNAEGLTGSTVHTRLDEIRWGPYQLLVMLCVGFAMLTESLEMGALAPMHTALAHSFGLSDAARSALPAMIFTGSAFGLAIAAPLCDRYGRKGALVMSLLMIALVMCATAALPAAVDFHTILGLRFVAGAAGAVPIPAGFALAVESCPRVNRASLVFGISFLGSVGYLIAAIGVKIFMPHFGEVSTDAWRAFCLFTAAVSAASVPLILLLHESPCFLAVKGDAEGCMIALDAIAQKNGRSPLRSMPLPEIGARPNPTVVEENWFSQIVASIFSVLGSHFHLFMLLALIDSFRTFFVSGSSYLWKDLFYQIYDEEDSTYFSPANLNIVASISPLIGLVLAERVVYLGVRRVTFLTSVVATCSLVALMRSGIRSSPFSLLTCIMVAKLTYGPLGTCIVLMKVEAFPTVVRVTAFSMISMASKIMCALAPTLVELLKSGETADSWSDDSLNAYLTSLAFCVLTCGVMTLTVPAVCGDGAALCDYAEEKTPARSHGEVPDWRPYGSTQSSGARGDAGSRGSSPGSASDAASLASSDKSSSPERRPPEELGHAQASGSLRKER